MTDLAALAERYGVPVAALAPDVLEKVILEAIREGHLDAIEGLIRIYLTVDASRAIAFYETLQLGLKVADLADAGIVRLTAGERS
jgi:hypothetical protein